MNRRFHWFILSIVPVLVLAGCSDETLVVEQDEPTAEVEEKIEDCSVVWDKELMITDLGVIGDPRARNNGPWSFGGIMKALAGTRNEQQFVKSFVESWLQDQVVDGVVIKARPRMQDVVLAPWKAQSTTGTYDLARAPFDLLAIVYRADLRKQGNIGDAAGEGRFIFGVRNGAGQMMPFTVIAEFRLPAKGNKNARTWANQWHALGKLAVGSAAYNQKLEEITNDFTHHQNHPGNQGGYGNGQGNDDDDETNLKQLRTNEIALDFNAGHPPIWELREFHIGSDGLFHPAHPAQTPTNEMNGTNALAQYVQQNAAKIQTGTHKVPTRFKGSPFAGGGIAVPTNTFKWSVPGVSTELQDKFSLQTCNGCHAGNTGTNFLHVGPAFGGAGTRLSDFLVSVEMPRRTLELKKALGCQ